MEEYKIINLIKKGYDIHILCDARRTETDSTGKELPNGRDFYGLYKTSTSTSVDPAHNVTKEEKKELSESNNLLKMLQIGSKEKRDWRRANAHVEKAK